MVDSLLHLIPVQIINEDRISLEQDAAVRRLLCECFASDAGAFSVRRAWNEVRPAFSVLGWHGEKVVGQVGIIDRHITCGVVPVRVAGIQSLAVAPDWRGSGLSQRLMTTAMHEAQRRDIRFGLLFCLPKLAGFYAKLGWRPIERAVTMRDAAGRPVPLTAKNIVMELVLDGDPLPAGPIDLQGRDW
jgi:predicted N-acetyltransferase YhbS